jgi:hypothetical protein
MRNKTNALIFYVESSCRNLHLDKTLETSENPADRFAAKLIPPEPLFGENMKPAARRNLWACIPPCRGMNCIDVRERLSLRFRR